MRRIVFIILLVFASQVPAETIQSDSRASAYFFSELLVWKLRSGSSENWAQEITPFAVNQAINIYGVPYKWEPGIRLGIGSNRCNDDWNTAFTYTGFKTIGVDEAASTTGTIHSPFLGNFFINNVNGAADSGPSYHNANIQWKVSYNVFDLELGRIFTIDPCFRIQPMFGLKCAFINQRILTNWQNPTTATTFTSASELVKNNFFGIGPSIGFQTSWSIFEIGSGDINLLSHLSGSLQWGRWNFDDIYTNNTPASVAVSLSPVTGAATMARGLLGIEWFGPIPNTQAMLGIKLGYESQIWFNQSQYYSLNMGRVNNLMSLQGGVLGLEILF